MIWQILIALFGIAVGYVLSLIAPEELKVGKKYFVWTLRVIFIGMSAIVTWLLHADLLFMVVFLVIAIVLLVVLLKKGDSKLNLLPYLVFVPLLFLFYSEMLVLLLFLYGFPVGLLLHET